MSEAERLADLLERDPSEWGGLSLGWKAAAELRRLSAELAALKAAIGEPVAFRIFDKDPTGGNDDRGVVYTKDEFKPGVNPTDFFDFEPLYVIPKDKP